MNRPRGLLNLGASCFMNASLQALFNMQSVEATIKSSLKIEKINLFKELTHVYAARYAQDHNETFNPYAMRNLCGQKKSTWSSGNQQDAIEYLEWLISELPELSPIFSFEQTFIHACDVSICKTTTTLKENDTTLRLSSRGTLGFDPVSPTTLTALWQEHGHDYSKCKTCNRSSLAWDITRISDVLFIQLPRVTPFGLKYMQKIDFPRDLHRPFVPVHYELRAVISHYGSAFAFRGHYKTFVYRNNEWLECDDETITGPVDFDRVVCNDNAYGLFYHRVDVDGPDMGKRSTIIEPLSGPDPEPKHKNDENHDNTIQNKKHGGLNIKENLADFQLLSDTESEPESDSNENHHRASVHDRRLDFPKINEDIANPELSFDTRAGPDVGSDDGTGASWDSGSSGLRPMPTEVQW